MYIFTVTEAASFLGVHSDTVRRGEAKGTFPQPRRSSSGARYYTLNDLVRLWRCRFGDVDRAAVTELAKILMERGAPPEEASQLIRSAVSGL